MRPARTCSPLPAGRGVLNLRRPQHPQVGALDGVTLHSHSERKIMDSLLSTETVISDDELLPIEVGGTAELTEGQGGGQSEDKRRAYNC
ncbi:hypothetical protein DUI70_2231 [Streptomyces albus]|nr:hypothetical protein DUI70_2231 [Streptomyces albus]